MSVRLALAFALAFALGACGASRATRPRPSTPDRPASPLRPEPTPESPRDEEVLGAHARYQEALTAVDAARPADAIAPLEAALAVYERKLAEDDARLRDTIEMLVLAYRGAERWKDAELAARRMLELARKVGPRTAEVTALNQLGLGFYESGDVAEASRAWEAAAAVQDELGLGMDDSDVRIIHRNLALAYGDLDRHADAAYELRRVLTNLELTAPDTLEIAHTMTMLAGEYHDDEAMKSYALDLYAKAVDIYTVQVDPDDTRLMDALAWKGSLMWTSRDLEGAVKAYQQILKVRLAKGLRDKTVASAYADLGVVETELHNSATAIIHLDQAIEIFREDAAPDLDQIITLLAWRSRARVQHKDFAEADADADEAIRMAIDLWGPTAKETSALVDSVASGYTDFKQARRGKAFRARAKKLLRAD